MNRTISTRNPSASRPVLGLALFLLAFPAAAQTGLLVPTSTGRPDPKVLSLREMSIEAGVARGYARVNVRQVFENHTGAIQEGTWRFLLPESGAVGDFAVWDGVVRIPGVILEKRRARAIYRDLTTQRIDPGLLQQGEEEDRTAESSGRAGERPSGGALFSVKVAPIPAWGTKRLELEYQQEVPWLDGVAELRIPLAPRDGEPMRAGRLDVRVVLDGGEFAAAPEGALRLETNGREAVFHGNDVALKSDVVVKFRPASREPLSFSAFRNPEGRLPDGLALAPWERPSEIPPEKDGFFLLEYLPVGGTASASPTSPRDRPLSEPARAPLSFAILFDTSLSHRWSGLEAAYGKLVTLLGKLRSDDRFVLIPFDRTASVETTGLAAANPASTKAALERLRARPLSPGTDVSAAVTAAAKALSGAAGEKRVVLFTDGAGPAGNLNVARAGIPLFTLLTGEERRESYTVASARVLLVDTVNANAGESAEETLFFRSLLAPTAEPPKEKDVSKESKEDEDPIQVTGGDPKMRDVYAVMTQPPTAGSLAGWVGRYAAPVPSATLTLKEAGLSTTVSFPEKALDARDLPRRWARARVDELLRKIELEGEKREWVEEIIELSRRYKFVTPYTAFLAAPRSLLRPRRIQPGDPVLRIETDPGIVAVSALLPFGKRIELVRHGKTNLFTGRFLVPEGLPDGRMNVRLVLRDVSGKSLVESKSLVLDGTPPTIRPEVPRSVAPGGTAIVAARVDADAIFLSARLDDGPPIPLRWDPKKNRSVAELAVPATARGLHELFFEAADGAGNRGFARASLEVR